MAQSQRMSPADLPRLVRPREVALVDSLHATLSVHPGSHFEVSLFYLQYSLEAYNLFMLAHYCTQSTDGYK